MTDTTNPAETNTGTTPDCCAPGRAMFAAAANTPHPTPAHEETGAG